MISRGIKRTISSILLPIIQLLKLIPGTSELIAVLEAIAALFGITGLAHAAKNSTITKKKLASASALLAILIEAASFIPAIAEYVPALQQIAAILGSIAAGAAIPKK